MAINHTSTPARQIHKTKEIRRTLREQPNDERAITNKRTVFCLYQRAMTFHVHRSFSLSTFPRLIYRDMNRRKCVSKIYNKKRVARPQQLNIFIDFLTRRVC